uniref:N-6 adenine-specific DNA methyltransferase 1 n=1 Tax=Sander lucioperca TaxID=283035 RepID=A0A8C9YQU7_SANLU
HLREVYERAEDSFLLVDISGWTFSSIAPCNNVSLQPAECLLPRLSGKVDVLLFNPPYVVTPSEEVHGYRGCLGRGGEVTDTFLSVVAQLLSSKGLFYLITIADNDPAGVDEALLSAPGCCHQRLEGRSTSPGSDSLVRASLSSESCLKDNRVTVCCYCISVCYATMASAVVNLKKHVLQS